MPRTTPDMQEERHSSTDLAATAGITILVMFVTMALSASFGGGRGG